MSTGCPHVYGLNTSLKFKFCKSLNGSSLALDLWGPCVATVEPDAGLERVTILNYQTNLS